MPEECEEGGKRGKGCREFGVGRGVVNISQVSVWVWLGFREDA